MNPAIRKLVLPLFCIVSLVFISSCTEEKTNEISPIPTTTNPPTGTGSTVEAVTAPNFTLTSLAGSNVSLSDFKDKVVVLFFFGNTCSSCRAVAPRVDSEIFQPYKENASFQLIGLDTWDGNEASVTAFKTATKVNFPLLLKASGVASSYKTTYDRLVVINKEGKIAFLGKQNGSADLDAVVAEIKKLL